MKRFIFFSILLFFSCSEEKNRILPLSEGIPDQESWGVTIIMTHEGFMRAKVKSGHLKKYNEQEYIILDSKVVVDFFDLQETHTSILFSDKAEINEKSNDMLAIGNVIAKSDSGITLFSETLKWTAEDEKLFTKDSIMITTLDKDTLFGKGFESDADLENWKIINPSGVTGSELQ